MEDEKQQQKSMYTCNKGGTFLGTWCVLFFCAQHMNLNNNNNNNSNKNSTSFILDNSFPFPHSYLSPNVAVQNLRVQSKFTKWVCDVGHKHIN